MEDIEYGLWNVMVNGRRNVQKNIAMDGKEVEESELTQKSN